MFERQTEYLKAVGIDLDALEFQRSIPENDQLGRMVAGALYELVSAEDRLKEQAQRLERDMIKVQRRLTDETNPLINALGEAQNAAQLNALCGEFDMCKRHFGKLAQSWLEYNRDS